MLHDLRVAIRLLRSSKVFSAAALAVLTFGIGASTIIFSIVDAVVVRLLPFEEPERIVAIGQRTAGQGAANPNRDPQALSRLSPQNYVDVAARQRVFVATAAIASGTFTLATGETSPEELVSQQVTAGFFEVLRTFPAHGRAFTADHEVDGQHRVAVLSDAFWRRRFGSDARIIGSTIRLDAGEYMVLGVMPSSFSYPIGAARPAELLVPYVVPPDQRIRRPRTSPSYLTGIGRLREGASLDDASAQMAQLASALQQEHPEWNANTEIGIRPLRDHVVGGRAKSWMVMLLGAVSLLVVIACANVAALLLARMTVREREVRIKVALGAGRWRVMRGLMSESLVLSTAAAGLGLLMSMWGVALIGPAVQASVATVGDIRLDWRALGAATAVSVLTGLLCGIVPGVLASKPDVAGALRATARSSGRSRGRQRVQDLLVVAEIALAVVLLVGTAVFAGSFAALMRIDPGFEPENVLALSVVPGAQSSSVVSADGKTKLDEVLDHVRRVPGVVRAAAVSGGLPLGGGQNMTTLRVPGREAPDDNRVSIRRVTADYSATLGIRTIAGRAFNASDVKGAPPAVMINELASKRFFGIENPIGRPAIVDNKDAFVVGVFGDVYQGSLEIDPLPEVFVPAAQNPFPGGDIAVKTSGDPYAVLPGVRAAVFAAMPDVPLRNVRSLEEVLAGRLAARRVTMLLFGLLGLLGLVISSAGLFGVLTHLVSQRAHEIGLRMALGATRGRVVRVVLAKTSVLVLAGLVIGSGVAWSLSTMVTAYLFRIDATDPRAFAAAVMSLAIAALAASAIPARRAATVDPVVALRAD